MRALIAVIQVACGSYAKESDGPFAIISEGCALRVLLEDYNTPGVSGNLGFLFPAAQREIKIGTRVMNRFPCFPSSDKFKGEKSGRYYTYKQLLGCYMREGASFDTVFFEQKNSLVTLQGEMFPHGLLQKIRDLLLKLDGKRILCIGAPRGCEKPEITRQPDWEKFRTMHDYKNFTHVYDWNERQHDGTITKYRRGFSEGWCSPDWEKCDMLNLDDAKLLRSISFKCPCMSHHALSRNFVSSLDGENSDMQSETESFLESFLVEDDTNSRFEQIYYDWRDYLADDTSIPGQITAWVHRTLNLPAVQGFLQTSGVVASQLSRFLIDLLYTVILLVVVLRSIIWWVETL